MLAFTKVGVAIELYISRITTFEVDFNSIPHGSRLFNDLGERITFDMLLVLRIVKPISHTFLVPRLPGF